MVAIHSKSSEWFVKDGDMSGSSSSFDINTSRDLNDASVFSSAGRQYIPAISADVVSVETLYDADTNDSDELMQEMLGVETVMSLWPAGTAKGETGYASGVAIASNYALASRVSDLVLGNVEINMNQVSDRVKSLKAKDAAAITASETAASSIDDLSSSSAGLVWYYHVFTVTAVGGNTRWQIIVQDSTNDSTFVDIETPINISDSAIGAARRAVSGTVNRYVRQERLLDATSGTLISHISYERL